MKEAPILLNEEARHRALLKYLILDTAPEEAFDQIVHFLSEICKTPMAALSFVGESRVWFKSEVGLGVKEIDRKTSFCGHVVNKTDFFEVSNTEKDDRFYDNPLCIEKPGIRFYAAQPLLSSDGFPIGTLCVFDKKPRTLNTTQKKFIQGLAQQVMSLLELRYQNLNLNWQLKISNDIQALTHTGGWELEPQTGNVKWSDETYRIHKVPEGTPHDKIEAIQFYAKHERARIARCVNQCIYDLKKYDEVFEFYDAEGNLKWVRAMGEPILDEGGRLQKIQGAFQDITDIKSKQVELEELNTRLKLALEAENIGVWDYDLKSEAMIWDKRMFEIFGHVPNAEMDGQAAWDYGLHPEDSLQMYQSIGNAIENGNMLNETIRILRPDGDIRYVRMVAKVLDENNKPTRAVGLTWDCTNEIIASQELEKQRRMMQHNSKLAAIGELAAGVAHEINNPLTIVMGFAKIIENEIGKTPSTSKRVLEALKKIEVSAERIAGIVMGLRSFSRVDSPVNTKFELAPLVRETVVMLDRMFQKEGISMTVEADDECGGVLDGSPGKIQQILVNLLTNSKDAFEEEDLKQIIVSVSKLENAVILKIKDTGKGISPEIQEKIFEPFFTTKDVNEGTGLGLSIVHTLVMEHKGKIEVSSQLGKGTVFTITFPLAQDSQSVIAA